MASEHVAMEEGEEIEVYNSDGDDDEDDENNRDQNDQNQDVIPLDNNDEPMNAMQRINMNTSIVEIQTNRSRNRAAYQNDDNDSDDPDESYIKSRSNKMPRLHSNSDLKASATNTKENKSPENEEEVIYDQIKLI